MSTLTFDRPAESSIEIDVERVVLCGFTGRDEAAVKAHVEELEDEGIEAPDEVPTYYPVPQHLLAIDERIEVNGERTSGEVEVVFLRVDGTTYVGVGSDHTDREAERYDILMSKLLCPNVVGSTLWRLEDVRDHWDELELRSWVVEYGERIPYQETTLDAFKRPDDLLGGLADRMTAPLEGTAAFAGSVATMTEELRPAGRFESELYDPVCDRCIECAYDIDVIDWME